MSEFAVTAIGRDKPGIVAAVSGALYDLGGNIADSRMAILGGNFAVMLIVDLSAEVDAVELGERLDRVRSELGLEAISVNEVEPGGNPERPSHLVSVYGADHPGIVHAVTSALAEQRANVTDLVTRVAGEPGSPVYVMLIEVSLGDADPSALEESLRSMAQDTQVQVTLREIGAEAL